MNTDSSTVQEQNDRSPMSSKEFRHVLDSVEQNDDLLFYAQESLISRLESVSIAPDLDDIQKQLDHGKQLEKMQAQLIEISKRVTALSQEVKDKNLESGMWEIRYSNRSVILSNFFLGCVSFSRGYLSQLRPLFKLNLPPAKMYKHLEMHLAQGSARGIILGSSDSFPFFLACFLFFRLTAFQRNLAFLISSSSSVYHIVTKKTFVRANVINLAFNLLFLITRYYRLYGLNNFKHDESHGFML